jgi:hypothetical protein
MNGYGRTLVLTILNIILFSALCGQFESVAFFRLLLTVLQASQPDFAQQNTHALARNGERPILLPVDNSGRRQTLASELAADAQHQTIGAKIRIF